jgi:nucleotide-binding universal stress UspA family protein
VVVVKGDALNRQVGPDHRVVVGTDGSAQAAPAVRFAADRAAAASASLEIVTCTGEQQSADIDADELEASAALIAQSAAEQLADSHPALAVTTRVDEGSAERTLVDASGEAGLVVVGTRGRGAFKGLMLGSVSHAVLYGAQCPVAVGEAKADRLHGLAALEDGGRSSFRLRRRAPRGG